MMSVESYILVKRGGDSAKDWSADKVIGEKTAGARGMGALLALLPITARRYREEEPVIDISSCENRMSLFSCRADRHG
jgi:hypothetical protein